MKTLLLLRHAKSAWDDPEMADHDRPLAPRGVDAARRVGAWLAEHGPRPSLILCSTARRAVETGALVAAALPEEPRTEFDRGLYLAGAERVLRRLHGVADSEDPVMVLGHNPDLERLARALAASGEAEALDRLREKFPTAGLAILALPIARWRDAGPDARLVSFVTPRSLEKAD